MKRAAQIVNAVKLVQARRRALGLPLSNVPTKVTDTTLYLVARIDGLSNIAKLTNDDTKKKVGITNFDGNKLADGRDVVIDAIKIQVAQEGLLLHDVNWNTAVAPPHPFLNAELKLLQNDKILYNTPVSDLLLVNDNDNYRDIATTPFLSASAPVEFVLQFPDGSVIPAETTNGIFIKISMRAIQAIQ